MNILEILTNRHPQIHTYLIQYLLHHLLSLLLIFQPRHIVNRVIHHFLSLIHDIVFFLEFHCYSLEGREVH